MAELRITESYEKKRTRLFWFAGLATILGVAQFANSPTTTLDVFKSGVMLDVKHIAAILLTIIVYQTASFWFDDRKITRLNSEAQRRFEFQEPLEAIRGLADQMTSTLKDKVNNILQVAEKPEVHTSYVQLQQVGRSLGESIERVSDAQETLAKRTIDHPALVHVTKSANLPAIMADMKTAVDAIENLPLTRHYEANKATENVVTIRDLLGGASERLQSDLVEEMKKLHKIRSDLLFEDKIQLVVMERAATYVLAGVAALCCLGILVR